jgi:hypothetical protein
MRSVRSCLWLSAFLLGASMPAFCQVIFPPNGSGGRIAADLGTAAFQQTVYSTGAFDASLVVFRNGQPKFCASGTVCTSGPLTNVSVNIPFGSFGMQAGDTIIFAFTVRHRDTEGGTCSAVVSLIPVGPAAGTTIPPGGRVPPPPGESKLWRSEGQQFARWARREDGGLG